MLASPDVRLRIAEIGHRLGVTVWGVELSRSVRSSGAFIRVRVEVGRRRAAWEFLISEQIILLAPSADLVIEEEIFGPMLRFRAVCRALAAMVWPLAGVEEGGLVA